MKRLTLPLLFLVSCSMPPPIPFSGTVIHKYIEPQKTSMQSDMVIDSNGDISFVPTLNIEPEHCYVRVKESNDNEFWVELKRRDYELCAIDYKIAGTKSKWYGDTYVYTVLQYGKELKLEQ